ncbi:SGNH/GDSL hydrolase family protein [Nonomuraea sp. bgisy101]|uniref:SGNH/GDSL hydrolase family protein n=1 Tax=Nonomuraea sp. bgisy101 TaxID=3413784 RepID=UPI003D70AC0E
MSPLKRKIRAGLLVAPLLALSAMAVGVEGAAAQPPEAAPTPVHATATTPASSAAPTAAAGGRGWTAGWIASPQRASAGFEPNWSEEGFSQHSVRQVVRMTAGGSALRVRLSNLYGTSPLRLTGATVARAGDGASIRPGSLRHLTFGRTRSTLVPAHGQAASDPVPLQVEPMESLTVTLYFAGTTGPATFHSQAYATSYRAAGDHRDDQGGAAFTRTTHSWYYLTGVDVIGGAGGRGAVVAFGDSITDGFGSTNDAGNRYPDELAELLAAAGDPRPVLNAGIGGNMVLNDSAWYGERSTARFRRDVLDQPGASTVIVLEGVNDIGFSESDTPTYKPNPVVSAREMIDGHRRLIREAHARGVKVIGATLLPFKGSDHWGEHAAAVSDELNRWIRTSGEYDAVADLDRAMAAPSDPDLLDPAYDSGDKLHPNDAGYRAMSQAVATALRLSE